MLHTKVLKEGKKAAVVKVAEAIALQKVHRRKTWEQSAREHVGKFIDKLTVDDMLKIGSVVSLTVMLQPLILGFQEITQAYKETPALRALVRTLVATGAPILMPFIPLFAATEQAPDKIEMRDEFAWLMAFTIAVLLVQFGPSILQACGGLRDLVKLLIA